MKSSFKHSVHAVLFILLFFLITACPQPTETSTAKPSGDTDKPIIETHVSGSSYIISISDDSEITGSAIPDYNTNGDYTDDTTYTLKKGMNSIDMTLHPGSFLIYISATDAAGNKSEFYDSIQIVDTIAPVIETNLNGYFHEITIIDNSLVTGIIRYDNNRNGTFDDDDFTLGLTNGTERVNVSALEGKNTDYKIDVEDVAGNKSSTTGQFKYVQNSEIDNEAPVVSMKDITIENLNATIYITDNMDIDSVYLNKRNITSYDQNPEKSIYSSRVLIIDGINIIEAIDSSGNKTTLKQTASNQPRILNITPTNNNINVAINSSIIIDFNLPMQPNLSFECTNPLNKDIIITGEISWENDNTRFIFTPNNNFKYNTKYIFTVFGTSKGMNGISLGDDLNNTFSTELSPFYITDYKVENDTIVLNFSEPIKETLMYNGRSYEPYDLYYLYEPTGEFIGDGYSYSFDYLNNNKQLIINLTNGIADQQRRIVFNSYALSENGNPLREKKLEFSLKSKPLIYSYNNKHMSSNVPVNSIIEIYFSKRMNKAQVEAGFSLIKHNNYMSGGYGGVWVESEYINGTISWENNVFYDKLIFTPNSNLDHHNIYTIKSIYNYTKSGLMSEPINWNFRTDTKYENQLSNGSFQNSDSWHINTSTAASVSNGYMQLTPETNLTEKIFVYQLVNIPSTARGKYLATHAYVASTSLSGSVLYQPQLLLIGKFDDGRVETLSNSYKPGSSYWGALSSFFKLPTDCVSIYVMLGINNDFDSYDGTSSVFFDDVGLFFSDSESHATTITNEFWETHRQEPFDYWNIIK